MQPNESKISNDTMQIVSEVIVMLDDGYEIEMQEVQMIEQGCNVEKRRLYTFAYYFATTSIYGQDGCRADKQEINTLQIM